MENSLVYLILITFFAICAFQYEMTESEDKKTTVTLITIVAFLFFFGFHGFVFTDWMVYAPSFEDAEWGDFLDTKQFEDTDDKKVSEPGFMVFMRLCKTLVNDFTFFTFVYTIIVMLLMLRFAKRREIKNIPFFFMMFCTFSGLIMMFDTLRNTLAIMIFINSLEFIEKRKPIPYYLCCILAMSFHLSAAIFLPLYFFAHKKINRWVFLSIFCGLFLFFVTHQSLIQLILNISGIDGTLGYMLKQYTETLSSGRTFNIVLVVEHLSIVTLVFIYYNDIIERYKGRTIIINMLILYFLMFYLLSDFLIMSVRMSAIFVFSYWVLWYDLIKILVIRRNKFLFSSLLYCYCMLSMYSFNKGKALNTYQNVLFGADTYEQRVSLYNKEFKDAGI